MKNKVLIFILVIIVIIIISGGCEEHFGPKNLPVISFTKKTGYVSKGATIMFQTKVKVGIVCGFNGLDKLKKLEIIKRTEWTEELIIEQSINSEYYNNDWIFIKDTSKYETYRFILTDEGGQAVADSLTFKLFN